MTEAFELFLIAGLIGTLFFGAVFTIEWMGRKDEMTGSDMGAPEGDDRSPFPCPTGRD
ncbi:hypothetical protein [Rhizobium sp. AG207R]|uniref:hypothetical protein n=1 Tax=Rhizobium sp. AG207R TaxID=2802287 RepID=UPI0022AC1422|nr:hypothetical protein [Rhizobium sp. AG207R]MCZ3377454.1 hypothetical protein [Rhizobium sp. AG207R]